MPELMKIDPNAMAVDDGGYTILHLCAQHAWVDGVKYLMSHEPKPDLTIKSRDGSSEFYRFVVKSAPNLHFFETKRFI